MSKVLGVTAVLTAPAAALVIDGEVVAASEEERFSAAPENSNPHHPASWRLPVTAMRWCLREAGIHADELDAVAYSYDPARARSTNTQADRGDHGDQVLTADRSEFADLADLADLGHLLDHEWRRLRMLYARRAPSLIWAALPDLDPTRVVHVGHDLSHAASAWGPSGFESCAVMVIDGRGESTSFLSGRLRHRELEVLATQRLPHSLGLLYEDLAAHLHVRRTCDERELSAIAAHGRPTHLDRLREVLRTCPTGGFVAEPIDWSQFAPPGRGGHDGHGMIHERVDVRAADLARSVQDRLEEIVVELAAWTHERTGGDRLVVAGDVALNRLVTTRLLEDGPFDEIFVQPVAGGAGTALGAAVAVAASLGDEIAPLTTTALGRSWSDAEILAAVERSDLRARRADDIAEEAADLLASDRIVAWVQGRANIGDRPLGHRSILSHPACRPGARDEHDRGPVTAAASEEAAPLLVQRGPLPSPYATFVHQVSPLWSDRLGGVIDHDGLARIHTVSADDDASTHRVITGFERRTGIPVLADTPISSVVHSMADDPSGVLGACVRGVVDAVAIGPFLVER